MLYPKNLDKKLKPELFKNPTAEYRSTPFWAWNCKLDKDLLMREIDYMKEMGMGGFHIHSREGMATPYLSSEWMDLVKACNEKAKQNEMLCWLYDEDKWPSGAAGGFVTKDYRNRARYIVFSPIPLGTSYLPGKSEFDAEVDMGLKPKGYLLERYEVFLDRGYLSRYKRLNPKDQPEIASNMWWAYIEVRQDEGWFNNQAYVNTLDPKAIQKFVEITHESYYRELGSDFGKTIPAIFTDEPQFSNKEALSYAEERRRAVIPFTDDFNLTYKIEYGDEILDFLPELFWELPGGEVSIARYRYHDHLSERFVQAFADTIGNWCEDHGIMFTGHVMSESMLVTQTRALGDAMRSYRSFQLPGIDMLCDNREYSTAKQAQSAAHQYGRPGVLSELSGVTNWDFDFEGHKMHGDWQAALGVTVRVHHLFWVSMGGESKRDYPASIGYQSPWYKEFPLIEDYFSRINTALTRGKPGVRIGVIHPVESYWLHWGPMDQTFMQRDELETNFMNIIQWLLFGLLDFDFICESLLPSQCPEDVEKTFTVGKMEYDVIVVPGNHTLRPTTVSRLESFARAGGRIIFAGEPPSLVGAVKSDRVKNLAEKCTTIPMSKSRLLSELDYLREVDVRLEDGTRANNMLYQLRIDGDSRWLFICHAENKPIFDWMNEYTLTEKITVRIKGVWNPEIYDALSGKTACCAAEIKEGETWITREFSIHESLLLHLEPGMPCVDASAAMADGLTLCIGKADGKPQSTEVWTDIQDPVPISLSEPNVLLLDMAEYSFDGGEWEKEEEILKIDTLFREKLGLEPRSGMPQPWVVSEPCKPTHMLGLRFSVQSDIAVKSPILALEGPEAIQIFVNGILVPSITSGWFVDESIKTVELPSLPAGTSEIILKIPFGIKTNVEWCYLLGDFGVRVDGRHKRIIEPVRTLAYGDWTSQGLPFYAGNVTYHCPVSSNGGRLILEASQFTNPLLSVSMDGQVRGKIAFAPYRLDLGIVEKGTHTLNITAFGNRFNAFGCVHGSNDLRTWYGPESWRTEGIHWCYQYRLRKMGILISPRLQER